MNKLSELDMEISAEELERKIGEGWLLIDIRDEATAAYGGIPGSVLIPREEMIDHAEAFAAKFTSEFPGKEGVVLYCARGVYSLEAAEELRARGINAFSLQGGYMKWLLHRMEQEKNADRQRQIEEGLRKTWRRSLFSPFARAIKNYELVKEGDRIAVCISGGKDSMLMAKLFQELQRHRKCNFELVFLVMNPGYNEENRRLIEHNAKLLGIPITVFETQIFDAVYQVDKSPCYLCARMRRGYLYAKAKDLGCNKIALGHHYDDVIETILMGMLHSGQIQTMMPKLHSTNFEGMELIRPMYLIREEDIKRWRDANDLRFLQCACRFTDTCTTCDPDGRTVSKRQDTKLLIAELKKHNPDVENHIFKSVENVSVDAVIGYKLKGQRHHFLEDYDDYEKEQGTPVGE